jgi:hypothetical protein
MDYHYPERGDAVERWLKESRDSFSISSTPWLTIDELLNSYRVYSDYGKPLSACIEGWA